MKTITPKTSKKKEKPSTAKAIKPTSPSFEDDLVPAETIFESPRTDTFETIPVDTSSLLATWATSSQEFKKRLSLILGKAFGLTDALASVQEELRSSKIDPSSEILDKELMHSIERIVSIRLQHEIISFLYEESSNDTKQQADLLFRSIVENKNPKSNPLRDLLAKALPKDTEESIYGDPVSNVGVKVSMKDSK